MRYLKPNGIPIKIKKETYYLKFTLDVIDELQDITKVPLPELMSWLCNEKLKKDAVNVLLKYLIGQTVYDDFDYYSTMLINAYIEQLKSKPHDGEKKAEPSEEYENINVERLFYLATVVLRKSDERAWQMTISEINTLYREHASEMGWLKEDKEVDIMDIG